MTRKDFELIAKVLDEMYLGHQDWQRTLPQVADKFAAALATTNPNFDKDRFLKAAGVEGIEQ